jgi:hypothetical protein
VSSHSGERKAWRPALEGEGMAAGLGKGRVAWSTVGGAVARATMEGAGSSAHLWRRDARLAMGGVGACGRAGEGWARRLGAQPGEGQTRHSARREVSIAAGGGAVQVGKGGGVALAGKGGGVVGGAGREDKDRRAHLLVIT